MDEDDGVLGLASWLGQDIGIGYAIEIGGFVLNSRIVGRDLVDHGERCRGEVVVLGYGAWEAYIYAGSHLHWGEASVDPATPNRRAGWTEVLLRGQSRIGNDLECIINRCARGHYKN